MRRAATTLVLCALAITAFAVAPAAASAAGEPDARMTCTAPGLVCDPCTVECTSPTGSVAVGVAIAFDGRVSSDDRVGAPSGTVVSWDWTFGDGATASGAQVSHAYAAAGTYPVTLTVTDDSALTDTKTLNFVVHAATTPPPDGAGTVPSASVTPSSLGFSAAAGTSSVPQTVTMTNNGDAPLMISDVALDGANPGGFSIANFCTSPVPASGGQCTVDVTFNPTAAGKSTATLIFTDNHQGTPNSTQSVQLSGTGTAPAVALAPTSLSFNTPAGATSAPQTVTLTNSGDATLSISGMALAGANPTRFGTAGGCPATLAPGARCSVGVTFSPTTTGTQTATLTFTDNAPGSSHSVALRGTGTPPPVASTAAPAFPLPPPPAGAQPDRDNDGVPDASDSCAATVGNLRNGCPSELNADIRGIWRVNTLLSQLLALTVRTRVGSRIEIRCSGKKRVCGFRTKVIKRTTRRTTSLTSYFKGRRILPAGTVIVVRVTRPRQVGTYERLRTRRGRKLPKVMNKCLSAGTAKERPCADG